jgi:type IV pilus assembly protein PilQ
MQSNMCRLSGALLCAVLGAAALLAQDPPPAAQPQGQPQAQPQSKEGEIQGEAGDRSSRLSLKLKDRDLRDVVASVRRKASVNIIMDPGIEEAVTIDLQDVPWRQALDLVAEQAGCVVTELQGGVLKVEKPPRITFAFENADIQKVVDTIAKIAGANIVVAPEVKGNITLRLKNIPWRDTLDAAVKTLGFVVVEEERGILRVVPASNIQQDLVTQSFQLRFVRPKSVYVPFIDSEYVHNRMIKTPLKAGEFEFTLLDTLKKMVTPTIGNLDYVAETNVLIVRDTKPVVDEMRRIISQFDVEPSQVFLSVKFVTTTNEDILDIGISPGGTGWTATMGLGSIPHRLPFNLGAGGWDDKFIANDTGTGPFADPTLNPGGTTIPDVVFGALDFTQVTATLRLLKKDSSSEILQAPQITALDHQTATIFVGEAVRYAQARTEQGQAGGVLLALEEGDESPVNVGFQLLATPHIVPGTDKVVMEVIPQRTALTGTGNSQLAPPGFDVFRVGAGGEEGTIALPRVASSTLATTVLLRSGQTAVLGGLVTRTQTVSETKLPFLGDIPVLGYLFKEKSSQDTKSTLIVFITPNLIRTAEDTDSTMQRILQEKLQTRKMMMEQQEAIFGQHQ